MPAPALESLLVGYDGTERSEPAVDAALALAQRFNAAVEILHAVPVATPLWAGVDSARLATANTEALAIAWKHLREPVRRMLERA